MGTDMITGNSNVVKTKTGRYFIDLFFGLCVLSILPPPILENVALWFWRGSIAVFIVLLLVPPVRRLAAGWQIPMLKPDMGPISFALVGCLYVLAGALAVLLIINTVNQWLYGPEPFRFISKAYNESGDKFDPNWRQASTTPTVPSQAQPATKPAEAANEIQATVIKVLSGDEFAVSINGETKTVRLIGVNTPESGQPLAKEAMDLLSSLVNGKTVTLTSDLRDTGSTGQLLRYVYSDEIFVNSEMIRVGMADFEEDAVNQEYDYLFRELVNQAKAKQLGLWAKEYGRYNNSVTVEPEQPNPLDPNSQTQVTIR